MYFRCVISTISLCVFAGFACAAESDATSTRAPFYCDGVTPTSVGLSGEGEIPRIVCADIVALDQTLVYNRFGSFNPFGMIFALRRDVIPLGDAELISTKATEIVVPAVEPLTREDCVEATGTQIAPDALDAGLVRLRDCKRPRPIVLRAGVGDIMVVNVSNLLKPAPDGVEGDGEDDETAVDFSRDFCDQGETVGDLATYLDNEREFATDDHNRAAVRQKLDWAATRAVAHGEADCILPALQASSEEGDVAVEPEPEVVRHADWPNTRTLNLVAQGLTPLPYNGEPVNPACTGMGAVVPGDSFTCVYRIHQEGTYFFASHAAPAGGEGDGGSLVHGLFGAILGEESGTEWYRSQVNEKVLDAVWPKADAGVRHARSDAPDEQLAYDKLDPATDVPYLRMLQSHGMVDELVHADINAIVWCTDACLAARAARTKTLQDTVSTEDEPAHTSEPHYSAFREFSVFFHDELKTFYTENFRELGTMGQLAGVKDGFAINYGASGMGSILLANRKGIGPSASCMECLYEEFFLTSWANGDPALLEWYPDDPSNVHHSYMNDPVVFRNFHAGPKETHVFHLHAHQWFAGNDPARGAYLDSQTVAPQQGFTYNIYHGGLRGINGDAEPGWWDVRGSGNRNRTVGDSIFHCHLYPHFAQGMWALWRVHDVFEDGTRLMPDGQRDAGLSTGFRAEQGLVPDVPDALVNASTEHLRAGSVDRATGEWLDEQSGTPIPALVPLPGEPLPVLPTYNADDTEEAAGEQEPFPGYPFYIPGRPGHRPPQAPLDIARALDAGDVNEADERKLTSDWLDGGIGRHLVVDGSTRESDFPLPGTVEAALATTTDDDRVQLARQLVSKAFALGNLTMHLKDAKIELLSNEGERLERAAMGVHHNGKVFDPTGGASADVDMRDAHGQPSAFSNGGYGSLRAPLPKGLAAGPPPMFYVNGSPPRPGAPFADPCGTARPFGADPDLADPTVRATEGSDPYNLNNYMVDPLLLGFRRYEVSAIQLDLIVNGAGWHDPQARINVLTENSHNYKSDTKPERASPTISDREEPFFFRAMSGECIEFRHTNELPKDLALDDFQVKTPTDTIGQHIHLVKFDVTSSDGSGNGWNYEDGTLAADELAVRRCAAGSASNVRTMSTGLPSMGDPNDAIAFEGCTDGKPDEEFWWRPLGENRDKFQTTVQRWFADPVLTLDEKGDFQDRTLRTVFTHDHFAPSSIQQHGFYAALVIEPSTGPRKSTPGSGAPLSPDAPDIILTAICDAESNDCVTPLANDPALLRPQLAAGGEGWTGAVKRVMVDGDGDADEAYHRDYREFALSIADFALLYDPRDRESDDDIYAAIETTDVGGTAGMLQLYCELRWRQNLWGLDNVCGNPRETDGNAVLVEDVPAWMAAGRPGDLPHQIGSDLILDQEVLDFLAYLTDYRADAAGNPAPDSLGPDATPRMAKPVAPPRRPESISVDHHDPYLVNYRGAPIPLRIGTKSIEPDDAGPTEGPNPFDVTQHQDCRPFAMSRPGREQIAGGVVEALQGGTFEQCSIDLQREGQGGDLAFAFSSPTHADPETPLLEAFAEEKLVFRMIQGAQEVQHTFRIDGQSWQRNIDQEFARGMLPPDVTDTLDQSPRMDCFNRASGGRPLEYHKWRDSPGHPDNGYWSDYEDALAECDNVEGFTFAQVIGISEHFELSGSLRSDVSQSLEVYGAEAIVEPEEAAVVTDGVPDDSSDYRYSFGSVDALWNGAWGLMRVYRDGDADDPAANGARIGDRLIAINRLQETMAPGVEPLTDIQQGSLSCPIPEPGQIQTVVDALAVAVESREIWDDGTRYRDGKTDADGLFLALLAPEDLGASVNYDALSRDTVLDAVRTVYDPGNDPNLRPFILRVRAGDCVRLRLINTLSASGGDPWSGLPDRLGDARMPPITPLNVGPVLAVTDGAKREGMVETLASPLSDVRPSAHLALSVQLPTMTLRRDLPSGAGYNAPPLDPSSGSGVTVSQPIEFYAGRVRIKAASEDVAAISVGVGMALETWFADAPPAPVLADSFASLKLATEKSAAVDILSFRYDLVVENDQGAYTITRDHLENGTDVPAGTCSVANCEPLAAATAKIVADQARRLAYFGVHQKTHWIPYAYGPVPVSAVSDVISQPVHGLFGIIDVVPRNWNDAEGEASLYAGPVQLLDEIDFAPAAICKMKSDDTPECRSGEGGRVFATVSARHVPAGDGAPMVYSFERGGETHRVREFVLFYQDGLNHWDANSEFRWLDEGGVELTDLKAVPECPVCDDSYDLGDRGVSYRSVDFAGRLRAFHGAAEVSDDLNIFHFPSVPEDPESFFDAPEAIRLSAEEGERVIIRVIHPGGRARQRSFAMNGFTYDDLFPGFGFPRSALLAPGKSITAHLEPAVSCGTSLWGDGPTHIRAGGIWGLLEVGSEQCDTE